MLSCNAVFLGVEGVHYGNVSFKINASGFLFHKANLPIFIPTAKVTSIQPCLKNMQSAAQ